MGEGEGLVTRVVGGAGRTAGDLVRVMITFHMPFLAFLNLYHTLIIDRSAF